MTSTRFMRSIRPELPMNADATQLVRPTMSAPTVAEPRPLTQNPGTSHATIPSEIPFSENENDRPDHSVDDAEEQR